MREVLPELVSWWRAGATVGVATVVATFNSAPRSAGASMLVGPRGEAVGSVSGGCVESAVYDLVQEAMSSGVSTLQRYGVSDEAAFSVGLTCGGTLDVFIARVDRESFPELGKVADDVERGLPVAIATIVAHPELANVGKRLVIRTDSSSGSLGSERRDAAVAEDARGLLAAGQSSCLCYGPDGERRGDGMRVFVLAFAPRPRMIVFGAIDFAASMTSLGAFLGYRVTVCDARPVFATTARFPEADEVVVDWPHRYLEREAGAGRCDERTVICVLTHDPKFDIPLLKVALTLPGRVYVGAMGSRRTHAERIRQLREAGLGEEQLERLSSPIGLDLGARTPEETAVSIAAEVIALEWGGSGARLARVDGPIHGPHAEAASQATVHQMSVGRMGG
jgi:xanthine dehydrogenase accessory factor